MSRPTQQEIERHFFEQFLKDHSLPEGDIEYSDKPDVVVRGERTLGIELMSLHKVDGKKSESEQVQSRLRAKVIELAERQYRDSGGRRIELWVDFDPAHPIEDVSKTAATLSEIATSVADSLEGHLSFSGFQATPEIRYLSHNGKEYADAKWRPMQSFDVPSLLTDRVKEVVASKAKKVSGYQKCDEYWLLLIVDFWDPAQDQYIDWPASESVDRTPFERVLLYKPAFQQVVEVPQRMPG